jgi:cell shape-determining protein MreC
MSYLLDKKNQRKKFSKIALGIFVLLGLFYFRTGIYDGLSAVSEKVFRPVLVLGNNFGDKFKSLGAYFVSKNYLYNQNQKLQAEVTFDDARMANYNSVAADNANFKEILGRKDPKTNMILTAILAKPNQSLYDTLLIDAGAKEGIKTGDIVFAEGNVPIGHADTVYDDTSKVVLFSNPGETTDAIVSGRNIFLPLIGRGGGNFEMDLPSGLTLQKGDQAVLPGINSFVLAIVQTIISDSRDPFDKALLTSPVNIQELKFVEVE